MTKNTLLGGLTPKQFIAEYWQKKPLLIKQAIPNVGSLLNKNKLIKLAANPDVESRMVQYHRHQWTLKNGPFKKTDFTNISGKWTLLVQGVNYFLSEAQTLLQTFNFIPYARLDDLMVSYAVDGGGVGPHVDSYDVFLLQGSGERLWQISNQSNQDMIPDAPLRILKKFKPDEEWLLEPGDMLYLPPNYAHHGVAVGECMTYSIGFRAPSYQELAVEFLGYMQNKLEQKGLYSDPGLTISRYPALINDDMIATVFNQLQTISFNKNDIRDFLGLYLSEPKPNLYVDSPLRPLDQKQFLRQANIKGIRLDLKTQMLYCANAIYVNGVSYVSSKTLKQLANQRVLELSMALDELEKNQLYEWYLEGYIHLM